MDGRHYQLFAALAGRDRAARSVVAPSGGQREVVSVHVAAVDGGRHGDGGDFGAPPA